MSGGEASNSRAARAATIAVHDSLARVFQSGTELARRIRERELSPLEAVDDYLERIERLDPKLNAFLTVAADEAREAAKNPPPGPLHGVPVGSKDLIHTKGIRKTEGPLDDTERVP